MTPSTTPKPVVLIIDDEEQVRQMITHLLTLEGFEVVAARDGSEAIHLFADRASEITAVTLDLDMPTTTGRETLAMLSAYAPNLAIVVATALPKPDDLLGRVPGSRGVGYIQKPFTGKELAAELWRVIAEASAGA